jgi:hypothetical protein
LPERRKRRNRGARAAGPPLPGRGRKSGARRARYRVVSATMQGRIAPLPAGIAVARLPVIPHRLPGKDRHDPEHP